MSEVLRVLVVFGTRPEIIKLAPVVDLLRNHGNVETHVVTTGQHRELAEIALAGFELVPDEELEVDTFGLTPGDAISAVMGPLSEALRQWPCDVIVVQGDTTSTVAGAQAGFYGGMRVAHVEAGLRSHIRTIPFPEEMNRRLVTTLTDIHFAPTQSAASNIPIEKGARIFVTGNTVLDSLSRVVDRGLPGDVMERFNIPGDGRMLLTTIHRRESWGDPLVEMGRALLELLDKFSDTRVVMPLHPNPIVRAAIEPILGKHPRAHLMESIGYAEFLALMARSHVVLTDSGGVVEEAPWFGKPVVVLRDHTDRPEGIESGNAVLGGTGREGIVAAATPILDSPDVYQRMATGRNPFGDGRASERILAGLLHCFDLGDAPEPFE